jgi:hypothetical protein
MTSFSQFTLAGDPDFPAATSTRALSDQACATGGDKRADTECDEDETEHTHDGLDHSGIGPSHDPASGHADGTDNPRDGAEKAEETDGDGDVHEEHAAFGVGRIGERAEDDEQKTEGGGDQGVRMMTENDESSGSEEDE